MKSSTSVILPNLASYTIKKLKVLIFLIIHESFILNSMPSKSHINNFSERNEKKLTRFQTVIQWSQRKHK